MTDDAAQTPTETKQEEPTPEDMQEKVREIQENLAYGMLVGINKDGTPSFSIHSEIKSLEQVVFLGALAQRLVEGELEKEYPSFASLTNQRNGETLIRILSIAGGLASVMDGLTAKIDEISGQLAQLLNKDPITEDEEETSKNDETEETTANQTSTGDSEEQVPSQE